MSETGELSSFILHPALTNARGSKREPQGDPWTIATRKVWDGPSILSCMPTCDPLRPPYPFIPYSTLILYDVAPPLKTRGKGISHCTEFLTPRKLLSMEVCAQWHLNLPIIRDLRSTRYFTPLHVKLALRSSLFPRVPRGRRLSHI